MNGAVLVTVAVGLIDPHPGNVRSDLGDLAELAASIRVKGVLNPLLVQPRPGGRARLLAGHRRLAAAKLAGLTTVPCLLRGEDAAADVLPLMLAENLQRADLTPMEQARACGQLVGAGLTTAEIARRTGKSPSWVRDRLAFLELPPEAQAMVGTQLTVADARQLAGQVKRTGRGAVVSAQGPYCPQHLTARHPLAGDARDLCDGHGHPTNGRIGRTACGACWEQAIRDDAADQAPTQPVPERAGGGL